MSSRSALPQQLHSSSEALYLSSNSDRVPRLSERINGQSRRMFKSDFNIFRQNGLTRQQALDLCIRRYCR